MNIHLKYENIVRVQYLYMCTFLVLNIIILRIINRSSYSRILLCNWPLVDIWKPYYSGLLLFPRFFFEYDVPWKQDCCRYQFLLELFHKMLSEGCAPPDICRLLIRNVGYLSTYLLIAMLPNCLWLFYLYISVSQIINVFFLCSTQLRIKCILFYKSEYH